MRTSILVCMLALAFTGSLAPGQSTQPSALEANVGDITANQTPLADVIQQMVDNGLTNIHVNWKALEVAGVDRSTPVSLVLMATTAEQVINAVNENFKADEKKILACTDDDGVLYVSTAADLKDHPKSEPLPARGDQQAAAQTDELLNRQLPEMNLNHIPVSDAIEFITNITQVPIEVNWEALEKAGVKKQSPVMLHIRNLSLRQTLRMLIADLDTVGGPLDYVVDGDHILISTRDELLKK